MQKRVEKRKDRQFDSGSSPTVPAFHGKYVIGQPFNPWRGSCGFYPPKYIGRVPHKQLGDGPKRLYERLVRYAGRNGKCFPSQALLAVEMGKGMRQVRYDLEKLVKVGLIRYVRGNVGKSNRYEFLYHPLFSSSHATTEASEATSGNGLPHSSDYEAIDCLAERQPIAAVRGNQLPPNISTGNINTINISSGRRQPGTRTIIESRPDDERAAQLRNFIGGLGDQVESLAGQTLGPGLIEDVLSNLKDRPIRGETGFMAWSLEKLKTCNPRSLGILKTLASQYVGIASVRSATDEEPRVQPVWQLGSAEEHCARVLRDWSEKWKYMPPLPEYGEFQRLVREIASRLPSQGHMENFLGWFMSQKNAASRCASSTDSWGWEDLERTAISYRDNHGMYRDNHDDNDDVPF